jgi:hypothetical protein
VQIMIYLFKQASKEKKKRSAGSFGGRKPKTI